MEPIPDDSFEWPVRFQTWKEASRQTSSVLELGALDGIFSNCFQWSEEKSNPCTSSLVPYRPLKVRSLERGVAHSCAVRRPLNGVDGR